MPNFKVVDFNPNESTGGAGCLCSEEETHDTKGPFVVFYGSNEMDSTVSPVPVLCYGCACEAFKVLSSPADEVVLEHQELPEL